MIRILAATALLALLAGPAAAGARDAESLEKLFTRQREGMITRHLIPRGVTDPAVLAAMRTVERHLFVPEDLREHSYLKDQMGDMGHPGGMPPV